VFLALYLFFAYFAQSAGAQKAAKGFVFNGNEVVSGENNLMRVAIGEKINTKGLKARFNSYNVSIADGEDCLVCAVVSKPNGSIEVFFNEAGDTVVGINSYDRTSRDLAGHTFGSSLRNATGPISRCDAGDSMTCPAKDVKGLNYIVEENADCELTTRDDGSVFVPSCARIGGFYIWAQNGKDNSGGESVTKSLNNADNNSIVCDGILVDVWLSSKAMWPLATIQDSQGGYVCTFNRGRAGHEPLKACTAGQRCRLVGHIKNKIYDTYVLDNFTDASSPEN